MRRIFWAVALLSVIMCGCTERARQKGIFLGGDPAVATDADMQEVKSDLKSIKKTLEDIRAEKSPK